MRHISTLTKNTHFQQLISFAFIGMGATLTHVMVFDISVERLQLHHLVANLFGFCSAFVVSYLGQFHWTFKEQAVKITDKRGAFFKFLKTALLGFAINLCWSFLILEFMQLHHYFYLGLLTFVTPIFIFLLNKFWVFK